MWHLILIPAFIVAVAIVAIALPRRRKANRESRLNKGVTLQRPQQEVPPRPPEPQRRSDRES